jgi:serine/threonine-protein kinase RsbW
MSASVATPLRGPVSMSLPFSAASAREVRRALAGWLRNHDFADGVIDDARLVVTELVGNAIRHATPLPNGTLLVRWRIEDGGLLITVCDGGGVTVPIRLEPGPDALGGRGLRIVEALGSAWWFERKRQVCSVHVRIDVPIDVPLDLP